MAKAEWSGTVISFRQSKHRQDSYRTIVDVANKGHAGKLMRARVVWLRKDRLRILGRVVARHGSKGAVRVRWSRGFPSQALGTQELLAKDPGVAFREAVTYLETAKRAQHHAGSDWSYWAWEGDRTPATVLIAIIEHEVTSRRGADYPPLPDIDGRVLMDKTSLLQTWAARL